MAFFRLRTVYEILSSALATLVGESEITDQSRGGVARTLLEATSLQDADQYVQIAKLRKLYRLRNCKGADLDERLLDYNEVRLTPQKSVGQVKFGDSNLTTKVSATLGPSGASAGSGTLVMAAAIPATFPATGTLVLDRGGATRENVVYTSYAGSTFTLSGTTTYSHAASGTVYLSTVGFDRTFPASTKITTVETDDTDALTFRTLTAVTLFDGDFETELVDATSDFTGAIFNVGSETIRLLTSPPFSTATVTNPGVFTRGRDVESDEDVYDRVERKIQSLSTGNVTALETAALGVSIPSGARVVSAQVVEELAGDYDVTVYIDNGNGTAQTTEALTTPDLLIHNAETGKKRARLSHWPVVENSLHLRQSEDQGETTSVTPGVGTFAVLVSGASWTTNEWAGHTVYDDNRVAFTIDSNTTNTFIVTSSTTYAGGAYAILSTMDMVEGTDYVVNETNGDVQVVVGLPEHAVLVAWPTTGTSYIYYTGLIQETQRVLNGDRSDPVNYPGVKSAGEIVRVQAPTLLTQTFVITISTNVNVAEETVVKAVRDAVLAYVNGLGVGDNIVLAEVIAAVMAVEGVYDARINTPTSNVVVLDGTLPRTSADLISVL